MSDEYLALVAKVGAFTAAALARRRDDMACNSGCDGCCQVWLSVSQVEADAIRVGLAALSPATRADVVLRGEREQQREAKRATTRRCAMLASDGSCAIYEHRPLVCLARIASARWCGSDLAAHANEPR